MKLPPLVRQRQVWVPTLWGWFLVLVAGSAATLLLARHLHSFLAPNRPVGARLLVVEGWLPAEELDDAIAVWRSGGYERVVTTGGPVQGRFESVDASTTYAERARNELVRRGLPADAVVAVPAPASAQDRSFLSAVVVREWAKRAGTSPDALDVLSSGAHGRRSWRLYRIAFGPQVRIGIRSARPSTYVPEAWWRTSAGAEEVLTQTIAWLWTALFFHPGRPGSHAEMWGIDPPTPSLPSGHDAAP